MILILKLCVGRFLLSVIKEKPKPKKAITLFDEDDEDGDIFSEKFNAPTQVQAKKEAAEAQGNPPGKKVHGQLCSFLGVWYGFFGILMICW